MAVCDSGRGPPCARAVGVRPVVFQLDRRGAARCRHGCIRQRDQRRLPPAAGPRQFQVPAWVERTFVFLGVCCMEDAPATWVATHRLHHKDSDERPDPHSPRASFWWSHMGWLLRENRDVSSLNVYDRYARDLLKQPFYRWLQRGQLVDVDLPGPRRVFFAAGFLASWLAGGSARRAACGSHRAGWSGASSCGRSSCGTSPGR